MIISSVNPKDKDTNFLWNIGNLTEVRLTGGVVTEDSLDRTTLLTLKALF